MNKKGIETGYRGRAETRFKKGDPRAAEAGRISGEKRREKRKMRDWAEIISGIAMPSKMANGETLDTDMLGALVLAQFRKGIKDGNTAAATFIATILGEMVEKTEVTGIPAAIQVNSQETADKLKAILGTNGGEQEL